MKNNQKIIQIFTKEMSKNLQYAPFISYDSNGYQPCNEGSSCCDDDYCRCYRITSCDIIFYPQSLANELSTNKELNWILSWWLKLNIKNEDFDYSSGSSYYGDEIFGIEYCSEKLDKTCEKLQSFLENNKSFEEQINCLLIQEYSYATNETKNKKWQFKEVPVKNVTTNVVFKDYNSILEKIERNKKGFSNIPLCVKSSATKYRIIDGNHRFEVYKKPYNEYTPGKGMVTIKNKNITIVCPIEESE